MDRFLPWFVQAGALHPVRAWVIMTLLNGVTLATYAATVLAAVLLVWRGLA